jgi:pimeloyl-ACP methyl ester carboxylesterase
MGIVTAPTTVSAEGSTFSLGATTVALCRIGSGAPVVYLHGLCDLHAAFAASDAPHFLKTLARDREVLAPALPGYNGSTGLDAIEDVEDASWHLADVFDALGVGAVDVVAHSLGAWYAAELALRHPDRVRTLVLLAPLGLHVPGAEIPSFFAAAAPRGIGGMAELRGLLFGRPDDDVAQHALPDVMDHEAQLRWFGGLAGAARLGWKAPHFQSRKLARHVARLTVPTLVLRGERDALVPDQVARAWAGSVPGARLVEVAEAGHCLPLERPDAADAVLAFLSESGAGRR